LQARWPASGPVGFEGLKLGAEIVEEQGADEFEDVFLGGVVRADLAAFLAVHDGLEQRAEDGGGDGVPPEAGTGEQAIAHVGVELGKVEALGKQVAVDVGELVQLLVEVLLPLAGIGVEDAEELFEADTEIGAVGGRPVANEKLEGFLRKDAIVLSKEAEEDADEEAFEFVAGVAAGFERVVEVAHQLRGFEVGGVFGIELVLGVAGNEGEVADVLVEVGQRKLNGRREALEQRGVGVLFRFEIVQGDAGEIGDDQPTGNLAVAAGVLEAADVGQALRMRLAEIGAGRFVFDEQLAGPEQVNKASVAGEFLDRFLEGGHGAAADAEDVEELVPEGLVFGGFAGFGLPILAKGDGAVANLVPRQRHGGSVPRRKCCGKLCLTSGAHRLTAAAGPVPVVALASASKTQYTTGRDESARN